MMVFVMAARWFRKIADPFQSNRLLKLRNADLCEVSRVYEYVLSGLRVRRRGDFDSIGRFMKIVKAILIVGSLLFLVVQHAAGQTHPTLVGTGYAVPTLTVAPGEIVTLQVTGLSAVLSSAVSAQQIPLPTQLAGISVTLNQYLHQGALLSLSMSLPLLSIQQANNCSAPVTTTTPDCLVSFITGQIPFEMTATLTGSPDNPVTTLVISENGAQSQAFSVSPNPSNVHVLTNCGTPSCVTHADGTLVTGFSPAMPGETVVIYAVGLGPTTPAVATGAATPASPLSSAGLPGVLFDFSPNAGPKFSTAGVVANSHPLFVGLTPGQVGLYQINVTLPGTLPSVPPCSGAIEGGVASNLSIDILTDVLSNDAAPICVKPPQ
jgi:uncharacterized protein (TIGR03437 family)